MNLVKWFRRNNTKVMAVVVIVLMVGFIGGSALTNLLRGSGGMNQAIAFYGVKKHKITPKDRQVARQELDILRDLGAGQILQYQDLRGVLLSELLLSESSGSAELINSLRQHIQQNRYFVTDKQLKAMYDRTVPTDIYWILLRDEARQAGFYVRPQDVGQMLGQVLPQLYQGTTYAQAMKGLVSKYGMTEQSILGVFGNLWAVLQYAEATCSLEDITDAEIRHIASYERQMLTADAVQLKASYFADANAAPSQTELTAQFDMYQDVFPGQADESNPYGFGYKLPDRVQLEYIAVDLTEVAATVSKPTAEETEAYYQRNRDKLFTDQVPSDPNDPNSPKVPVVKSYVEVADTITDRLTRESIISKAQQVLLDARNQADAGLETLTGPNGERPTVAALAKEAGDYETIAAELSRKNGVTLYSGRTGQLSAADVQSGKYLGQLLLTGYGSNPIRLSQFLFSVKEFGDDAVTLMFVPAAEMYRSIGPAQNPMLAQMPDLSGQVMAIMRIVAVEPASAPSDVNVTYSTKTLTLGGTDETGDDVYSVKEKVVDDLKVLGAWDTTKTRAQELIELATKDTWEAAVAQFNERFGAQASSDPNDPNVFEVDHMAGLQKIPAQQMEMLTAQVANSPGATAFLRQLKTEQRLISRLYSLIPAQSDTLDKVPLVLEFKPDHSFYCLKDLSIRRLNQKQFEEMKPALLERENHVQSQSLAAVHFNPQNILTRTKYRPAQENEAQDDEETPAQQKGQEDAA